MNTPKSDTQTEVKSKQPTGSSKRKRKHSIKRNIVLEENSNSTDSPNAKTSKVEKNTGKRAKVDKTKPSKEGGKVELLLKEEIHLVDEIHECKQEKNVSDSERDSLKADNTTENCINLRSTDPSDGQCTSTKEQCQNCKFCSEHVAGKDDSNESKDKQLRNKKKFTCEICAKDGSSRVYNSVEKHKHHMATAHEIYTEEIKRFECTDCPETVWFPTKSKFTYHLGTKHPGIMRFICEVCTETFIMKANYKSHMKTHNLVVQKKFSCDVCNGTFVNKAGYEAHKRRFPGPHIKQSCSHCGFSFSREKHMKNHRCKTLLLEAAAKANKNKSTQEPPVPPPPPPPPVEVPEDPLKIPTSEPDVKPVTGNVQVIQEKKTSEASTETDLPPPPPQKKQTDAEPQQNKRVVFHRIIPRRNQEQPVYKPVQVQTQSVPESLVVQELREIDLESGTFIAAPATEPEQQFIVRDLNGHILQLDINEAQQGEENQVYLTDWNIVAPYVIREKSP